MDKMEIIKIPMSMLNGKCLHCRPVENGKVYETIIRRDIPGGIVSVFIDCKQRMPESRCLARQGQKDPCCLWWRGDGYFESYQIVGPGMDKKKGENGR